MKNIKHLFAAVLFGALFASLNQAQAQQSRPGFATAIRVQGVVSYTLGDGKWYPLVPGKYLPPGSAIRTDYNGTVDVILGKSIDLPQAKSTPDHISAAPDSPVRGLISFKPSAEQNMVRLVPNTTMSIDRLNTTDTGADTVSDTELDLKEGKMFASVKKLSGASQYLVKVPQGVAGVRGTWFSLGSDGSVAVYESQNGGLLLAVNFRGVPMTIQVDAGKMFVPATATLGGSNTGNGNNSNSGNSGSGNDNKGSDSKDGNSGSSGQPTTIPIPAALAAELGQVFDALKTVFHQSGSVANDNTVTHTSSVGE